MLNWNLISQLAFPVFVAFGLAFIFKTTLAQSGRKHKKSLAGYWQREHAANSVRKKDIPNTLLIEVDFTHFPKVDAPTALPYYEKLMTFTERKMANLKHYSNTELKEQYGASQLDTLANYESNYFEFMDISYKYANILYDLHNIKEAQAVLETLINLKCDYSKLYLLLTRIYKETNQQEALISLKHATKEHMISSPYYPKIQKVIDDALSS